MSFDLRAEVQEVENTLAAVRTLMANRAGTLPRGADAAAHWSDLTERLRRLMRTLPPPEPTPPKTEHVATVEEVRLEPVGRLRRWLAPLRLGKGPPPDARGRIPVRYRSTHTVVLDNPLMPGTGPFDIEVPLDVGQLVVRMVPRSRKRLYQVRTVTRRYRIHIPAIPADEPLTPAQAAFVERREQLKAEVRDIATFLRRVSAEVDDIQARTDKLRQDVGVVAALVGQLPRPPEVAAELKQVAERIDAVVQSLPALEQDIEADGRELRRLTASADAL